MEKKKIAIGAISAAVALALILSVAAVVVCVVGKDGKDGRNGDDFNLYAVYQELIAEGEFSGTYAEFVAQYLSPDYTFETGSELGVSINAALTSVVSIEMECNYRVSGNSLFGGGEYAFTSDGSGVIYSLDKENGDAYIITNCHVVYPSSQISYEGATYTVSGEPTYKAWLYGQEGLYYDWVSVGGFQQELQIFRSEAYAIECSLVGYVMSEDIAVLKVENSDILKNSLASAVTIGDSDKIAVGDEVFLIGNSLGEGIAATTGIVSVESEVVPISNSEGDETLQIRAIRTDAAASPGNSGGGMFDKSGRLIGILFAGSSDEDSQNMNDVLPVNRVCAIADSILDAAAESGSSVTSVQKAVLGVTVYSSAVTQVYDDETDRLYTHDEVTVSEVSRGSASSGKLQAGDVLVSVTLNGKTVDIDHSWQIGEILWQVRLGDTLSLLVERDGGEVSVELSFDSESYFTSVD